MIGLDSTRTQENIYKALEYIYVIFLFIRDSSTSLSGKKEKLNKLIVS